MGGERSAQGPTADTGHTHRHHLSSRLTVVPIPHTMRRLPCMLRSATAATVLFFVAPVTGAHAGAAPAGAHHHAAAESAGSGLDVQAAVAVIDQAITALTEEQRLIADGAAGAGDTGPNSALATADRAGAAAFVSLRDLGITPTAAMRETLQLLPRPGSGTTATAPAPARYTQALIDLRTLRQELLAGKVPAAGSDEPPDATQGPAATTDDDGSTPQVAITIGAVALALAAVVLVVVVLLPRRRGDRRLAELALRDDLTGVGNRRHLNQALTAEPARGDRPTSVLMVDIDHFKQFNDDHGHHVGDEVLKAVASALCASVRAGDVVYRYGGEEFCVLLDDVSPGEAATIAERIRTTAGHQQLSGAGQITVSVGVAHGPAAEVSTTLRRADTALMGAKRDGRDRVNVA